VLADFEVRALKLDELFCPVRHVQTFVAGVQRSIDESGLRHPVIVVRIPREDLIAQHEQWGTTGRSIPDRPWLNVVCGGTNRVEAARGLGFTHIDCLLVPDFDLAMRIQERQRRSYVPAPAQK